MSAVTALLAALPGIEALTQPQQVRRRSRDFYWYSPILKEQLDACLAEAVLLPANEAELIVCLEQAYRRDVPVTARGAGTGNYGQAMPLRGGVVLDLTRLDQILAIGPGTVRAEAGARLLAVEQAALATGQELRFHPSTLKTATLGGFVAGGSSGIGSVTHGLLRDRGNIQALRVVTMEAAPRILELKGADIQKVNHAYGTNGIITELSMPLAPAFSWVELVVGFDGFMAAARLADAIAGEIGITKKLVTAIAAPVPGDHLFKGRVGRETSVVLLMVAPFALDDVRELIGLHGGTIVIERPYDLMGKATPLFEHSWNHTTLSALRDDRTITYLQLLFPPPRQLELIERMVALFGDEVPMHLEYVRLSGMSGCFGLPLVRYRDRARLEEIMALFEAAGCPVFDPHAFTLEEGGMKAIDPAQLAFKHQADPKGLLNPGKMLGFDDPNYGQEQAPRRHLYDS